MKFYRPVKCEDFIEAKKDFESIPIKARELIKLTLEIKEAVDFLYNNYSYSKRQAREACNAYLNYLKAMSDYYNDRHEVYVEY